MNALQLRHSDLLTKQQAYNAVPKNNLKIICDNILDTFNLAGVFRLADAVGANEVIITGNSVHPMDKKVIKGSMHLSTVANFSYCYNIVNALKQARLSLNQIVALDITHNAVDLREAKFGRLEDGIGVIVGNEAQGCCKEALDMADMVVKIPQWGMNHSLNVVNALSIAVYKILENQK